MTPQPKRFVLLAAVSALCAGPALAQGTFSPGAPKPPWAPSAPKAPAAPTYSPPKPKTYGQPEQPKPFKPYEPYKSNNGTSLFGPDGKPKR
jgi:hypothetical protein